MVCGGPRTGTSCVAGVLHHLGVPMGATGGQKTRANPKGFFEDKVLRRIAMFSLRSIWDEDRKNTFGERVDLLVRWWSRRRGGGPVIGGKYPRLCVLIEEMHEAIPNLRIIVPERDPVACARSMKARWAPRMKVEEVAPKIAAAFESRDKAIDRLGIPCLRFGYEELVSDPARTIERIIRFLDLKPLLNQIERAVEFVDPKLNRFGG